MISSASMKKDLLETWLQRSPQGPTQPRVWSWVENSQLGAKTAADQLVPNPS